LFHGIVGAVTAYRWLPGEEFLAVITGKDAANRFIGGAADQESETVALLRGNLQTVVVPFSFFEPSGDGVTPDFDALSFTDYGHTVAFGEYEASADAILYETDDDYRRKLNKERKQSERGFGASLRRLRLQRRLKRSDFPGVSSKTIARMERGDVEKPHGKTLETIAQRLGVSPGQIETF
jgi:DNA-binding Xre family transcriptional regulator